MPQQTYHVALAFEADSEGQLQATEVIEAPTPQSAVCRAKQLAMKSKGAVAFSRSGNLDSGDYTDAKIHLVVGDIPADVRTYVSQIA